MEYIHHPVAQACKPVVHYVTKTVPQLIGVTYLNAILACLASAAVAAGLAWYIRGRGLTGVSTDINNIKTDVANLKAKISSTPAAV